MFAEFTIVANHSFKPIEPVVWKDKRIVNIIPADWNHDGSLDVLVYAQEKDSAVIDMRVFLSDPQTHEFSEISLFLVFRVI